MPCAPPGEGRSHSDSVSALRGVAVARPAPALRVEVLPFSAWPCGGVRRQQAPGAVGVAQTDRIAVSRIARRCHRGCTTVSKRATFTFFHACHGPKQRRPNVLRIGDRALGICAHTARELRVVDIRLPDDGADAALWAES